MKFKTPRRIAIHFSITTLCTLTAATGLWAQGTLADYERAQGLQRKASGLVVNTPVEGPSWLGQSDHFWYGKSVKGGTEFVMVDAAAATKKPAFDHEKLAAAINAVTGHHYTALTLPFAPQAGRGGRATPGATPAELR